MRYIIALAAAVLSSTPAYAMTYFLVREWDSNGDHFCQYDNGTVLNVGIHLCALSIRD